MISQNKQESVTQGQQSAGYDGGNAIGFSGSSNIGLPIYEIKLKGLTIPLGLKYNNSGIKVNQEASNVGLGWSLDAGGEIIRVMRGIPDDVWKDNPRLNKEFGFLLDRGQGALGFNDNGVGNDNIAKQLGTLNGFFVQVSPNNWATPDYGNNEVGRKSDTDPDLFLYRFAGRSGKFVFGNDGKIKFLNYQPFQTSYVLDENGNPSWTHNGIPYMSKGILSFSIIDESGNKFIFSDLGTSENRIEGNRIRTLCDLDPDAPNFVSYLPITNSWYLTRIETFYGEIVNYTYTNETVYTWEIHRSKRNTGSELNDWPGGLYRNGRTTFDNKAIRKRLALIETPNETISFTYGLSREDINGTEALSFITIKAKPSNLPVKSIMLDYDYFSSSTSEPTMNSSVNSVMSGNKNPYKRLKLNHVFVGVNGDFATFPKYSFVYDERQALPNYYSYQQDFWGYFNANSSTTLFPRIYVRPDLVGPDRFSVLNMDNVGSVSPIVIEGANRNVNPYAVSIGTLTQIIYPTGGYSTYEYEANDFMYKGKQYQGGGIRVKSITNFDGISHHNDIKKEYYRQQTGDPSKTSGQIFDLPIFAYLENNCANDGQGNGYIPPSFATDSYNYFFYNMTRIDHPMHINGFGDDLEMGYAEVREQIVGTGYTTCKYSVPVKNAELTDPIDGHYSVPHIKYLISYIGGFTMPDQGPNLNGTDLSDNSYPFIQNTNYNWARGLLLEKSIFDISNNIKRKTTYSYNVVRPISADSIIYGLSYMNGSNYNIKYSQMSNNYDKYVRSLVYYNKYKVNINLNKLLSSEETIDYLPNGAVTTVLNYSYTQGSFPNLLSAVNSLGEVSKIRYRYPFDIIPSPSSSINPINSISFLVQKNNVAKPLETIKSIEKDGQEYVVGAHFLNYSNTTYNTVASIAEKVLQINQPLPISQYNQASMSWEESYEQLNLDSHFNNKVVYSKYDEKSNVLETVENDAYYKSYIYGYNKFYPIAVVDNARYHNVFHENFEEDSGNAFVGHTGIKYFNGSYFKNLTGLDNGEYILTYWQKNGSIWGFHKNAVSVSSGTYSINLNGLLDDICFYPSVAQITTFTYRPMIGIMTQLDQKGQLISFEYDSYNRVSAVRDQNGNILKSYKYNFRP